MRLLLFCLPAMALSVAGCSDGGSETAAAPASVNVSGNADPLDEYLKPQNPADQARFAKVKQSYQKVRAELRTGDPAAYRDGPRKQAILEDELRRLSQHGWEVAKNEEDAKDSRSHTQQQKSAADAVMNEVG